VCCDLTLEATGTIRALSLAEKSGQLATLIGSLFFGGTAAWVT
jgi:hypothetical protein